MSTPTVLPAAALAHLSPVTAAGPARGFVRPALARGALYLVPVPLAAVAVRVAGEPLGRLPWPVPVGALALGWCLVCGLRWAGSGMPVRRIGAGLAVLAAAWSALLALGPTELVGADRPLACAVSLAALALAGGLALAARQVGRAPTPWPGPQRRIGAYLVLGLAQAAVVIAVWPAAAPEPGVLTVAGIPPALVPLLVAVPLVELCAGWHLTRLAAGLALHEDRESFHRYVRRLGWATLAALLPPLVAGAALAGTATRLPYGLSAHPDAPALVLAMAAGVLLAGLVATGWLLAARDRPLLAALVTGAPVPAALAWHAGIPGLAATSVSGTSLSGWGQLLPATVLALAVVYAAALVLAGHVLFDSRSHH